MKTLIIYNSSDSPLMYTILDGDYSELNGVYLNSCEDIELQKKALDLLYKPNSGDFAIALSTDVSIAESKNWDKIACITFIL